VRKRKEKGMQEDKSLSWPKDCFAGNRRKQEAKLLTTGLLWRNAKGAGGGANEEFGKSVLNNTRVRPDGGQTSASVKKRDSSAT